MKLSAVKGQQQVGSSNGRLQQVGCGFGCSRSGHLGISLILRQKVFLPVPGPIEQLPSFAFVGLVPEDAGGRGTKGAVQNCLTFPHSLTQL